MHSRLDLRKVLRRILENENTYFQPPESVKMSYPAIVYSLSEISNVHADNRVYAQSRKYQLMVIDYDPDSLIVEKVSKLPTAKFVNSYTKDNLYHTIFTIFY